MIHYNRSKSCKQVPVFMERRSNGFIGFLNEGFYMKADCLEIKRLTPLHIYTINHSRLDFK